MKKRLQRITGHAAGTPKTSTFATCLCFRVTMPSTTTTAIATTTTTTTRNAARVKRQMLSIISWWLLIFSAFAGCSAIGYSYSRFEGPVVGPEQLVQVPDAYGGGTHSDYVARPEYSFAYGVEDGQTRLLQNRKETRNGDTVKGVYSVVDPDGTLRVVKYTADDANGFQAEVITNGIGRLHGHGANAAVDEQVEHEQSNEVHQPHAANEEEDGGEEEEHEEATPQQGKGQYKVHEDYDEAEGEAAEGEEEGDDEGGEEKEGGGDHEEYEGSSEEGYEDANAQQEEADSSEEY